MHAPTLMAVALIGAAMILECDLGRHRVTWFRTRRAPLVSLALIVPLAPAPSLSGTGLALEIAGIAIGAGAAWLTMRALTVRSEDGTVWQRAGIPYAAAVLGFAGARCVFTFGAEHWFPDWLGRQIVSHDIAGDAFADALIYVSLAFSITRTMVIIVRRRRARRAPAALTGPTRTGRVYA